jgi:hypothetical protein
MDMRIYYSKIHEAEQSLPDPAIVVSLETSDGGKAGVLSEVSRRNAARLIVENRARPVSADEARQFRAAQEKARREAEQFAAAGRMQVTVVPSADWLEARNPKSKG